MKHKQSAFTLIELLIVIAIIGILASIVLANLSGARKRAQISSIKSSLSSLSTAGNVCVDGSGNILDGNGGDPICDDVSLANEIYPAITACGKTASDSGYTVVNSGAEDWEIMLTVCTLVPECVDPGDGTIISCTVSGCVFSGSCQ